MTIEFVRTSDNYPEYHLGYNGEHDVIFMSIPADENPDMFGAEPVAGHDDIEWAYVIRDDGFDLDADFETHCDDLAEEARVLMAEVF